MKHLNFKTLYFNFKYFPFVVAIKLPVFIARNIYLKTCEGSIELPERKTPGMIRIGFGDVGLFDKKYSRGIWAVNGKVRFNGNIVIGHGNKIIVGEQGTLTFGDNVNMTAESTIVCFHEIKIGNDCLISWDIEIMDTDFHEIYDKMNTVINPNKSVCINNHVWLGAGSKILKGTTISNDIVVAANTLVTDDLLHSGCIYGGHPVRILKENIQW